MVVTFEVRGVLAGAYKGRDISARALLTHVVRVEDGVKVAVLCRGVKLDSLCDIPVKLPATCPTCARRHAKATEQLFRLDKLVSRN